MPLSFHIRDAKLPEEKAQLLEFIHGSQRYEHAFEPDRRLDAPVAEEFFAELIPRAARLNGRVLVADRGDGKLLGWVVVYEEANDVYVRDDERMTGYVSELFVIEDARGKGIGRALLEAADEWARARKLKVIMIGVLPGNVRARRIYEGVGFTPYAIRLRKYL